MKNHQNFLNFNGEKLLFLSENGTYWIALKPILRSLKVSENRSLRNVKNDPILGSAVSVQTLQVSKKGIFQGRNMVCLPEKYIYGWIFSLRSDSTELIEYKKPKGFLRNETTIKFINALLETKNNQLYSANSHFITEENIVSSRQKSC